MKTQLHSRLFTKISFAALVAGSIAACSSSRSNFEDQSGPKLPNDPNDSGAPPATCEQQVRCSPDLKKVLRGCEGAQEVVATCNADQGCGNGTCIEACVAADVSKGSAGCAFYTLPPDTASSGSAGSCFAAMIANTWDREVTIQAELGADPLDITGSTYYVDKVDGEVKYTLLNGPLPPGKVAVIFLSNGPDLNPPNVLNSYSACPREVNPAVKEDPIRHRTGKTRAFRLSTNAPVSAYSMYPYGGATSYFPTATLLLPVSSWGTNYYAINSWSTPRIGNPMLQIVAAENDTEVRMRPVVDMADGNEVAGTAKGVPQSWTIQRGEVLQINQPDELTGSPIETSKPVAVFGGSESTYIPSDAQAADCTQQQIPPISQWGHEYPLVPYRPRTGMGSGTNTDAREMVPYRFVGAANGTKLIYNPERPLGAPQTLEAGQVVTFTTDRLATVKSQDAAHAFYAAVYMTGAILVSNNDGDPDFVNLVPADQFLDRYVFFADYSFPQTTLTLIRRKTQSGFAPVTIDCVGEVSEFRPLGDSGEFEYAWVELTRGGSGVTYGQQSCGYGRHEATSDGPFSIMVWGTGYCASYGYAGGMGSRPLNDVKAPVVK
jgi:IgGFc binding protein